jgi:LmbE family N-acetylglucosaminyl deacetylase
MKHLPFHKVLALSAHTDDIEFGCGATIHRLLQQGSEVYSVAFSLCEESVPEGWPKDILLKEMYQSAEALGIQRENIRVYRYPVRRFPQYRQEILEDLVGLQRELRPDLVFVPSRSDIHQDHHVICQEAIRAFRCQTLLGYQLPWNTITFTASALLEVQPEDVEAKAHAIACYRSQEFRHHSQQEYSVAHAHLRGVQNRTELAEAFEVMRLSL